MNLLEDFLASADPATLPAALRTFRPAATVFLTPQHDVSPHAVGLLLDGAGSPRIVAKIVRRPGDCAMLESEFSMLRRVIPPEGGAPIAPLPLTLIEHRDQWILFETALAGRSMLRDPLWRSPARAWELVDAWLSRLAGIGNQSQEPARSLADQITEPLRLAASTLRPTAEEEQMFASTEQFMGELARLGAPAVVEHGDVTPSNVYVASGPGNEQRIAAIDWEFGTPAGLAGADAAVFLELQHRAIDGVDRAGRDEAYRRNFLHPRGAARLKLAAHLQRHGVEPTWVDHVLLAAWARRALRVFPRLAAAGEAETQHQLEVACEAFRSQGPIDLWRLTLAHLTGTQPTS